MNNQYPGRVKMSGLRLELFSEDDIRDGSVRCV